MNRPLGAVEQWWHENGRKNTAKVFNSIDDGLFVMIAPNGGGIVFEGIPEPATQNTGAYHLPTQKARKMAEWILANTKGEEGR
jgi:hypothetical protein